MFYVCNTTLKPRATLQRHHSAINQVTKGVMLHCWRLSKDDDFKNASIIFNISVTVTGDFIDYTPFFSFTYSSSASQKILYKW